MTSPRIEQSWFVRGMVKATTDMWLKGWDERNAARFGVRPLASALEFESWMQ